MLKSLQLKTSGAWTVAVVAIALKLAGCTSSPPPTVNSPSPTTTQTTTQPKVVVTTSVLCNLTQAIAQNTLDLLCLVGPAQDPHTYQPKPEDRRAIETAQLIFYGGYDHEPTLLKLVASTNNPAPKVAVHEKAVPKPLMGSEHRHGETETDSDHSHSHETEPMVPDPHIWHNAQNGIRMVSIISEELQKVSPNQAELYRRRAKEIIDNLEQLDRWIKAQIATIPPEKRKLVATHDALSYYANAYGLEIAGALQGITTNEQPTPKRVAELATEIQSAKVPSIFAETTVNPKLIEAVAREAKVKIAEKELYSDGLGATGSGADTYEGMLMANTCAIAQELGGQCTPFTPQRNR